MEDEGKGKWKMMMEESQERFNGRTDEERKEVG